MKKRVEQYQLTGYTEHDPAAGKDANKLYYLLQDIFVLKQKYNKLLPPLHPKKYRLLYERFYYEYIYQCNHLEGNTLTLEETRHIFLTGWFADKTVRAHYEVINHEDAILYVKSLAQNKAVLSPKMIKDIHLIVLSGLCDEKAGKYRNTPHNIEVLINKYIANYNYFEARNINPVILCGFLYIEFLRIEPFYNYNRFMAVLLLNYHLLKNDLPIIGFKPENKKAYKYALNLAQEENNREKFYLLIAEALKENLKSNIDYIIELKSKRVKNKIVL